VSKADAKAAIKQADLQAKQSKRRS